MARVKVVTCATPKCWAIPAAGSGSRYCPTHDEAGKVHAAAAVDPAAHALTVQRQAERAKAAKARAKLLKDTDRELAETAAFSARMAATGLVPKEGA